MVKCPSCGSENPTYVSFCGRCAASIPSYLKNADEGAKPPQAPVLESGSMPMKRCNWCGELNKWSANFCTKCGRDPHGHAYLEGSDAMDSRPRSGLPVAGGILSIFAGLAAIGMGLTYLFVESVVINLGGYETGSLCFCGGLCLVFGAAGVFGGVSAIQRKNFVFALVGSILGMLGIGFFIGGILGFIGLILIAVSKEEFED